MDIAGDTEGIPGTDDLIDPGRLSQVADLKSDNTTLSSFLYSLDNVGNRTGVQEANGDVVTWSYDNTFRLTREQRSGANAYDITYTYDPVGNRLTQVSSGAATTSVDRSGRGAYPVTNARVRPGEANT